jgi:hypothetical protein
MSLFAFVSKSLALFIFDFTGVPLGERFAAGFFARKDALFTGRFALRRARLKAFLFLRMGRLGG